MAKSPIAYRIARGSFWLFVGVVITRLFSLFSSICVARILGKESYGELGMYQSTIDMLGIFAGFGLGLTATKFVAEFGHKDPEKARLRISSIFLMSIITSTFMAVVLVVIAPWLSTAILNRANLTILFRIGSLTLVLSTVSGVVVGIFTGLEAFRKLTRYSFWQGLSIPLVTIPAVWLFGIYGAVCAGIITGLVGIYFALHILNREFSLYKITLTFTRSIWSEWQVVYRSLVTYQQSSGN